MGAKTLRNTQFCDVNEENKAIEDMNSARERIRSMRTKIANSVRQEYLYFSAIYAYARGKTTNQDTIETKSGAD